MIPATGDKITWTTQPSALEQWLSICLIVGMFIVVSWLVRGVLALVLVVTVVAEVLYKAHRRGVARVRAYNARLLEEELRERAVEPRHGLPPRERTRLPVPDRGLVATDR